MTGSQVGLMLDSIDLALLYALNQKCRSSFSELASRLELPVQEIKDRMSRYLRERIIQKFTVVPTPALFGAKEAVIHFSSGAGNEQEPIDLDRITLMGVFSPVTLISTGTLTEGFAIVHYRSEIELAEVVSHFRQVCPFFAQLAAFPVQTLTQDVLKRPKKSLLEFEKVDWLILTHLREQGRLPLGDLSIRTHLPVETIVERLDFLRTHQLIDETIWLNPALSHKRGTWTLFKTELTFFTSLLLEELEGEITRNSCFWPPSFWKVEDQNILILGFFCSSYTEVEKIQSTLTEIPGLKSIEKLMGGTTYYFQDYRDELLEEKKAHGWFSPEQWVV
ncbi:MAG: AsnC family transcriptional regulator [Candidatus Thorarchaeota archaeon]